MFHILKTLAHAFLKAVPGGKNCFCSFTTQKAVVARWRVFSGSTPAHLWGSQVLQLGMTNTKVNGLKRGSIAHGQSAVYGARQNLSLITTYMLWSLWCQCLSASVTQRWDAINVFSTNISCGNKLIYPCIWKSVMLDSVYNLMTVLIFFWTFNFRTSVR